MTRTGGDQPSQRKVWHIFARPTPYTPCVVCRVVVWIKEGRDSTSRFCGGAGDFSVSRCPRPRLALISGPFCRRVNPNWLRAWTYNPPWLSGHLRVRIPHPPPKLKLLMELMLRGEGSPQWEARSKLAPMVRDHR